MRQIPVLVSRNDGTIMEANTAAGNLLGQTVGHRCSEVVRAEDLSGHRICNATCAQASPEGGQRDVGAAHVRGSDVRVVCSAVGEQRVITLIPTQPVTAPTEPLTPREREVLALVARGYTSQRIARRLGVSLATVRTHVEHTRSKLGARSRSQAVARAMALGQLD